MNRSEALRRLAEACGIEPEYWDCGGQRHETSDATREKLLAAMGFDLDGDLEALVAATEEREWLQVLPPVIVVRSGVATDIALTLPADRGHGNWRWTLMREDGSRQEAVFDPAALERLAQRRIATADQPEGRRTPRSGGPEQREGWGNATHLLRLRLPLPAEQAVGYHQLEVTPDDPALGNGATMPLIVVPAVCHQPEALRGEARLWGAAVQLYGLRSRHNWGIGDFGDLRAVVDLCAADGGGFVGVNPLHALFPTDPGRCSPYSPNSRLALNVLYIDVEAVVEAQGITAIRNRLSDPDIQAQLRRLRSAELVDYEAVASLKLAMLRLAWDHFRDHHLIGDTAHARAWRRFRDEGGETLAQFALFEALHAHCRNDDPSVWGWPAWPGALHAPDSAEVRAFADAHGKEVDFAIYLQWLADQQLGAAAEQAKLTGIGIGLYRDLALGADPGGAEIWAHQDTYARDAHIGAPPDDFSPRGQDWGLPPPIPQRLRKAAYRPWIATLRANMRHAGALRIDHVMALSRLFWVPAGESATDGAYVRYSLGDMLGILALESVRNQCLVVGEDLGTVSDELRAALAAAGVLSYRPLYFERDGEGSFKPPQAYPRQALAAVSTHDLPTLAGFWQGRDIDERARLELFASAEQQESAVVARAQDRARLLVALQREDLLPAGIGMHPVAVPAIDSDLSAAIHAWLARTPTMLLAVQAEDIFGVIDQANLPGTGEPQPNWRRRLPIELENWSADDRQGALVEALRRERGSSIETTGATEGGPRQAVIPDATYRLQFNRDFTMAQATQQVPYLAELGISHCYASPYLKARPGSMHGYDIVDHNAFNPEIGTETEFEAYAETLAAHGMSQVLDIVPNHMGVMGADNGWWLDVLENGQASAFASYFDIDWRPLNPELRGKVLLPILGDHYGTVLGRGELQLAFDAAAGEFSVYYYQHRLPVDPAEYPAVVGHGFEHLAAMMAGDSRLDELQSLLTAFGHLPSRCDGSAAGIAIRSRDKELHKQHLARLCDTVPAIAGHIATNLAEFNGRTGDADSFDLLHNLIKNQSWRLAYWRVAADGINYRRFFDINDLAAVRMENPEVFAATHQLILSLVARGWVQGLRIDHADGLYDPAGYFRRLQDQAAGGHPTDGMVAGQLPLYLVIEKILAEHERLPDDWPIHGASGYRFANLANSLFIDASAEKRMTRIYDSFTGSRSNFDELVYEAKRLIIFWSLQGELNVLANLLSRIAAASRHTCDFTLNSLRGALAEVVACFPVYRGYFVDGRLSTDDRRHIEWAVAVARRRSPASDITIFDFIGATLTGDIAEGKNDAYRDDVWRFAMKFQQFTSPVMAKGTEDTAFYRYHRLVSLNEVGGDPRRFGISVAAFHAATRQRAERWPHNLLAGSTHDSKRSEDVRARIDVLSEIPAAWKLLLRRWARINRSKKRLLDGARAPSANDEYLLYQTLFGTWPLTDPDEQQLAEYTERITQYMIKAVREAKEHSSWINVNADYEAALVSFIAALLAPGDKNLFLADFVPTVGRMVRYGLINSLAQTLLRLTSPGVPDLYQGSELWQFQLVDPDNRRPVDFALRQRLLAEVQTVQAGPPDTWRKAVEPLVANMLDGRIKLYLTWSALQWRRRWREVFRDGDYLPLLVVGACAEHACAYARRHGERIVVTVVPRLLAKLRGDMDETAATNWADTRVELPADWGEQTWLNAFTGTTLTSAAVSPALTFDALLSDFPVALLLSDGGKAPQA